MIHLHLHDNQGSLLDATPFPEQIPEIAKEYGMKAVGISNHGTMHSVIDFYKACKENDIKPIIGCELYVCNDMKVKDPNDKYYHLIVIAKNNKGYKNLLKLSSIGYTEGFYYKPRIDMETLEKYKQGLIISTACLGGEIPKMILNEKIDINVVYNKLVKYKSMFEDFYLEVQPARNEQQKKVNRELLRLSEDLNIPLLATSDVHFLRKEDYETHGLFIQANEDRDNEVYQDCWFKTEDEVFEVLNDHIGFQATMTAIDNTHKVADMCNVEIQMGKSYLPDFPVPPQFKGEDDYLKHLINLGFVSRKLDKLPKEELAKYIERARYEYEIITFKKYSGYFLIVQDFLEECRKEGIYTGDGRGSADNSLICYLLHITNVDPIVYKLNFSRFLTIERTELPDIDMDIQSSRKADAVNILRRKYGYSKVAQICTFGRLMAKAILDTMGKVLDVPYGEIEKIKKFIPDNTSLEKAVNKSTELQEYQTKYPKLFEVCLKLEGIPRSLSTHAGGVVIAPSSMDMSDFTALALAKEKDGEQAIITQLEMHNVEEVGLVKMDCLATVTLDVIADCLDLIFGEV